MLGQHGDRSLEVAAHRLVQVSESHKTYPRSPLTVAISLKGEMGASSAPGSSSSSSSFAGRCSVVSAATLKVISSTFSDMLDSL